MGQEGGGGGGLGGEGPPPSHPTPPQWSWECGTQLVQQRHLCQQAVKERGSPPVMPGAHPSPCVRSRGTGGQRVSVTRRMRCPGPLLPGGLSVGLPWPAPPGLEHQATLAPHTQGPAPAHTPAPARAYTQDDGIFRPPALRWGLVAVDSPLGLGTGQSGCSASWWGREGSPHPRACSCMRPPAQPNPTPPQWCRVVKKSPACRSALLWRKFSCAVHGTHRQAGAGPALATGTASARRVHGLPRSHHCNIAQFTADVRCFRGTHLPSADARHITV